MKLLSIGIVLLLIFGCTSMEETHIDEGACTVGDDCNLNPAYLYIPLSEVSPTVKHYSYNYQGTEVKYFAVVGPDGEVKTAFDACEVCHAAGKGYSQDGDSVICNNCGLKFRISELGEKNKGTGCWPAHLEHEIQENYILIKKTDVEAGSRFFS